VRPDGAVGALVSVGRHILEGVGRACAARGASAHESSLARAAVGSGSCAFALSICVAAMGALVARVHCNARVSRSIDLALKVIIASAVGNGERALLTVRIDWALTAGSTARYSLESVGSTYGARTTVSACETGCALALSGAPAANSTVGVSGAGLACSCAVC
jgi:hypothetical protein